MNQIKHVSYWITCFIQKGHIREVQTGCEYHFNFKDLWLKKSLVSSIHRAIYGNEHLLKAHNIKNSLWELACG